MRRLQPVWLLVIAYLGFITLGLPDPVAGVAWPSVRETFGLHQSNFGLIFLALGVGYCASGFFGGTLTQWLGLGNLLWLSSAFVAVAMFADGLAPAWGVMIAAAVIWGLGSGGIDAGLNAYASKHFSPRHVNWLHACYSLGATIGPLMMTAVLVTGGSWRTGYLLVGTALSLMALVFLITRDQWNDPVPDNAPAAVPLALRTALGEPLVWLQAAIFFLYVGLEFTVGQWSFTILTEARHVSSEQAGLLAGGYYGSIGVGRVLAGFIAPRLGLDSLLRGALLTAVLGTGLFALDPTPMLGSLGLILTGLGLAPVFPCLMSNTPLRLGTDLSTHAVGFQVSAGMVGAALMPGAAGLLAERLTLNMVGWFALALAILLVVMHEILLHSPRK